MARKALPILRALGPTTPAPLHGDPEAVRLPSHGDAERDKGPLMNQDEQAIRALVATWMEASARGDLPRVLELMAEDVVFLGPGRPPMRGREGFAAASRAMKGEREVTGTAEIQEVRVFGDWAYCWNQLTLDVRPAGGGASVRMRGPALSVLHREPDGKWVIFRDANMVSPVEA